MVIDGGITTAVSAAADCRLTPRIRAMKAISKFSSKATAALRKWPSNLGTDRGKPTGTICWIFAAASVRGQRWISGARLGLSVEEMTLHASRPRTVCAVVALSGCTVCVWLLTDFRATDDRHLKPRWRRLLADHRSPVGHSLFLSAHRFAKTHRFRTRRSRLDLKPHALGGF